MSPPGLLVLTDRTQTRGRPLVHVVGSAVAGGAGAVVLREKDLPHPVRAGLAAALRPLVDVLLAASDPVPGVDGLHLAARQAVPLPRPAVVGRSCHGRADLEAAAADGVDYVTVSPVFATRSKPGYGPALGVHGLRAAVERSPLPVYALGGVGPAEARACVAAGAAGVAVMGAVMRAVDPAATTSELLDALAGAGVPR